MLSNQGLVKYFAYKYDSGVIPREDLESIGNEALIRAIHQFDYINKSIEAFSTYIGNSIEHEINVQFKKNNKHSHVISLNQPIYENNDGNTLDLENMIDSNSEKEFDKKNDIYVVRKLLTYLTEKERQVIILRYGLDGSEERTLEEVGNFLGCTKQAIYQQEQKALEKMRRPMRATNPMFYNK